MARISKDPLIRQAELIEEAQKLFFAKGYQATTIQDIVAEVGVSHGTFYYHFNSKEALLEALIVQQIERLIKKEEAKKTEHMDPLVHLNAIVRLFYQICYQGNIAHLTDILYAEKQGELINRIWRQANYLIEPVLKPILEECNAKKLTKVDSMPETLWFLGGIIATLLETTTAEGYAHEKDRTRLSVKREMAARLIERLLGVPEKTIDLQLAEDIL